MGGHRVLAAVAFAVALSGCVGGLGGQAPGPAGATDAIAVENEGGASADALSNASRVLAAHNASLRRAESYTYRRNLTTTTDGAAGSRTTVATLREGGDGDRRVRLRASGGARTVREEYLPDGGQGYARTTTGDRVSYATTGGNGYGSLAGTTQVRALIDGLRYERAGNRTVNGTRLRVYEVAGATDALTARGTTANASGTVAVDESGLVRSGHVSITRDSEARNQTFTNHVSFRYGGLNGTTVAAPAWLDTARDRAGAAA